MPSARLRIALVLMIASTGSALAGCTPSATDTVSAISTTTAPTAAPTLSADQRARGEALLSDAAAVLGASAGVVDEERRSVLDSAIPPLRTALDTDAVSTFDATIAAVVAAREVVSGRVVELAQAALDESPSAEAGPRDGLLAATATLRDTLTARAEAATATAAALAGIAPVRDSHAARVEEARAEIASREASEAEEEAQEEFSDQDAQAPAPAPAAPEWIEVPVKPLEMPPAPPMPDLPTLG
ncbi:hypothetical protein Q0F99_13290 [Rathayibacter oskolensis]|uniref:hypothetical protein n=1 Tax=Rathayibacter oskolensis TaxID=1891671 RepID=UPI00265EF77C|nr:hypothetical protein [Rathayibacter oskolensis]WKK70746.1 hypothetical protein Q0F99_13290 [Rathayibacter oskolensis]